MISPAPIGQDAWYLVHTKPKQEFRALEQLENQGYRCFLPTIRVERVCRARKKISIEPLFARYLLIRLNILTSNWARIRSTRGVDGLVKFGERFAMLSDDCVETLRNAPQKRLQLLFVSGERVAITSGPFAGLEGIYQAPDGETRALILIEMMNQPQKLSFAMEMLRKAA